MGRLVSCSHTRSGYSCPYGPIKRTIPFVRGIEQIVDTDENLGPIAGIMAAQAKYPRWLGSFSRATFRFSTTVR